MLLSGEEWTKPFELQTTLTNDSWFLALFFGASLPVFGVVEHCCCSTSFYAGLLVLPFVAETGMSHDLNSSCM